MRVTVSLISCLIAICSNITGTYARADSSGQQSLATNNQTYQVFDIETTNHLLDLDENIEQLADGFSWTEGPVWVESENYLLFSDIPNHTVMRYRPEHGVDVFLSDSGFSNGLLVNHENQLILMQSRARQIAIMDAPFANPKSNYLSLVSRYDGKMLNSPNDVTISANGDLYFTDPPYGLVKQLEDPAKELPFQGVYRLDTEGGLTLLDKELTFPNGIALYDSGKKIIVAVSDEAAPAWYSYDVEKDGSLKNKTVFAAVSDYQFEHRSEGLPDGLKEHSSGAIFATGPGGVWVFNSDGELASHISVVGPVANLAFDANEGFLYLTAKDRLLRLKLK